MTSLWITGVVVAASSCATKPVIAPPPLPERPALASLVQDRNDQTGEVGVWMNFHDLRLLTKYAESVEAVRKTWR